MDGTRLQFESNVKFLGVTLDEFLTWESHCNAVANRMAQNSGILNRIKKIIPNESRKTLYHSLIFPHYSYCLEAWGNCPQRHLKRIKTIQKKAIRATTNSHWLSHTEPRMKSLNILKLEDQHHLQCLTTTFNMLKGHSPDIFNLADDRNRNPDLRPLRSTTNRPENLRLPAYQPNRNTRSFQASTLELWNDLPL